MNIRETNKGNIKMVLSVEQAKALNRLLCRMSVADYRKFIPEDMEYGELCVIWIHLKDFMSVHG